MGRRRLGSGARPLPLALVVLCCLCWLAPASPWGLGALLDLGRSAPQGDIIPSQANGPEGERSTPTDQPKVLDAPHPITGIDWQLEWSNYRSHLCSIHLKGVPLCHLMGGIADFNFNASLPELKRSVVYMGENCRMRRVVHKLLNGKDEVKIGVIGASVSWGEGSSYRGRTDWWHGLLRPAIQSAFPKAKFTLHNGCFNGTRSSFANMCLSHMAPEDLDILVIEYITTDTPKDAMFTNEYAAAYERMIRKILKRPSHVAALQLQFLAFGQGMDKNSSEKKMFHETAEDQYHTLSQYYNMPVLSFRDALWHDSEGHTGMHPQGWDHMMCYDRTHPGDLGHRYLLEIFMWYLHQTTKDLLLQPFSNADLECIHQELPPPQFKGNWEETNELCFIDDNLKEVVDESRSVGWEFLNEGTDIKRKQGYVTKLPDKTLYLKINMSSVLRADIPVVKDRSDQFYVMISYLKSYEHMGQAKIACALGCECTEQVVDAHNADERTSTTFMIMVPVKPASADPGFIKTAQCQMRVSTLPSSSSGENKFKVTAVMMSPKGEEGFGWGENVAGEFKAEESLVPGAATVEV